MKEPKELSKMESEELKLLRELVRESRERRVKEACEEFANMMSASFMDDESRDKAMKDHKERLRAITEGQKA